MRGSHRLLSLGIISLCLLKGGDGIPKLTESYRHYEFDLNWVDKLDPNGKPLADYSKLSAEDHIQQLLAMHASSLMMYCMTNSGYTLYDSKVGQRHPTLSYDYAKEMIRLGHEKGLAMELYIAPIWGNRLVQQHPSWGVRRPDGSLSVINGQYLTDPNSPAGDWYVNVIKELVPAYHGDALFLDGLTFPLYGPSSTYTARKFQAEVGRPLPQSRQEDPDWRGTLRWGTATVEAYFLRLRDAAKQGDPQIPVSFNGPGPGGGLMAPHLFRLADYCFTEAGSEGEYATWMRGVCGPKPFKMTFLTRHSILDPFDPNEMRARIGRAVAVGGATLSL